MKISVELSAKELQDVIRFSGEKKKGPAIRKFLLRELMLKRRREISRRILAGECSADLPSMEELRQEREVWKR